MNLFDLIDGLFTGVVSFFYSYIRTLAILLRHPCRSANMLIRDYRNPAERQVSSRTCLLVSFVLLEGAVQLLRMPQLLGDGPLSSSDSSASLITTILDATKNVKTSSLLPVIIMALIPVSVTDASLRLFLMVVGESSSRFTKYVIDTAEYALSTPVIITAFLLASTEIADNEFDFNIPDWMGPVVFGIGILFVSISGYIVARIMLKTLKGKKRIRKNIIFRRRFKAIFISCFAFIVPAYCLLIGFLTVGIERESEDKQQMRKHGEYQRPTIVDMRCFVEAGRVHAQLTIYNRYDTTQLISSDRYRIAASDQMQAGGGHIEAVGNIHLTGMISGPSGHQQTFIVEPNAVKQIDIQARVLDPLEGNKYCALIPKNPMWLNFKDDRLDVDTYQTLSMQSEGVIEQTSFY